ncbi:hypothetical protein AAIH15_34130, partial [Pseudomonas aeruginosa]
LAVIRYHAAAVSTDEMGDIIARYVAEGV